MATNSSTPPHAFALAAREGRTQEALNILGADVLVKLGIPDTDGSLALFHQTLPYMAGPPLHRHSHEDEWFYVLDGEITAVIDDQRIIVSAGGSAFAPRGTAHTFQNFHHAPVHMLVMVNPGNFQRFFEQLSALNRGLPVPDLVQTEKLMNDYGIDLLGPSLS